MDNCSHLEIHAHFQHVAGKVFHCCYYDSYLEVLGSSMRPDSHDPRKNCNHYSGMAASVLEFCYWKDFAADCNSAEEDKNNYYSFHTHWLEYYVHCSLEDKASGPVGMTGMAAAGSFRTFRVVAAYVEVAVHTCCLDRALQGSNRCIQTSLKEEHYCSMEVADDSDTCYHAGGSSKVLRHHYVQLIQMMLDRLRATVRKVVMN